MLPAQLADAERQATQAEIDPDAARVAAARRQAAREDVVYHWALAETYLRDPALQSSMRCALRRRRRLRWILAAVVVNDDVLSVCVSSFELTSGSEVDVPCRSWGCGWLL